MPDERKWLDAVKAIMSHHKEPAYEFINVKYRPLDTPRYYVDGVIYNARYPVLIELRSQIQESITCPLFGLRTREMPRFQINGRV